MRSLKLVIAILSFLFLTNLLLQVLEPSSRPNTNGAARLLAEHKATTIVPNEGTANTTKMSCRVAVTNSKTWHYETLESIAGQMPLYYLNLTLPCQSIVFDYHISAQGKRYKSWVTYFDTFMQGRDVSNLSGAENGSPSVRRIIGDLVLHDNVAGHEIIDSSRFDNVTYDTQVEASCYCQDGMAVNNHGEKWMLEESHRTCIFHEVCPIVSKHPRALWPSPHHEHYYIPTILPRVRQSNESATTPKPMCVVGATHKREWNFLKQVFNSTTVTRGIKVHILGFGHFPEELLEYKKSITMASIMDYREFHEEVARCGAILLLLSKSKQPQYFVTTKSSQKLTGALPPVLAYNLPVLMHEELYNLYKADLPANLVYATHNEDLDSFQGAMNMFLEKLDVRNRTQSLV